MVTDIISVKTLLQNNKLYIPHYQRPYKWTEKNVNQLIDDVLFHKKKSAYRLGTLVLHEEEIVQKKENYEEEKKLVHSVVDGQQRSITLTLIAFAIVKNLQEELKKVHKRGEDDSVYTPKLELTFDNDISKTNIQNNYKVIERRIQEMDEETIRFFYEKCEVVLVTLDDISEAFQFFDSQNARGKDLDPHDLLKSFHLREMNGFSTEDERKQTVASWEAMDTDKLALLFSHYLFRIRKWSKGYSARYFTKNDVDIFKGVSPNISEYFPYANIYRIAHYYTTEYNSSYHRSIDQNSVEYPFQLDQLIINGKRFFEMVAYYDTMIEQMKARRDFKSLKIVNSYDGRYRTGDKYVYNLFYCGLVYYVDKFGEKDLEKAADKIFIWAYTLRLKLQSVRLDSVDNYALHKSHARVQLFRLIREAIHPRDITNVKLEFIEKKAFLTGNKLKKVEKVVERFIKLKYYAEI